MSFHEEGFWGGVLPLRRIFGEQHVRQLNSVESVAAEPAAYFITFKTSQEEEVTALLKRVEEFVYRRPLLTDNKDTLMILMLEEDKTCAIRIPEEFFKRPEYQDRLREFATLKDTFKADSDAPKLQVPPDVAIVALSHASHTPWQARVVRHNTEYGNFSQLRLETEYPVDNPVKAKVALEQRLGLPDRRVFIAGQHITIPASAITPAHIENLRDPQEDAALRAAMYASVAERGLGA